MRFRSSKPFKICKLCKCKLIKANILYDDFIKDIAPTNPYEHYKQNPLSKDIKIIVEEPEMLIPNSFEK